MPLTPSSLGRGEPQQCFIDFIVQEIDKNRTAHANVVAMVGEFRRKEEPVHERSVLARPVLQHAASISEGKTAVLGRNQRVVQTNVITCPSSDVEIG